MHILHSTYIIMKLMLLLSITSLNPKPPVNHSNVNTLLLCYRHESIQFSSFTRAQCMYLHMYISLHKWLILHYLEWVDGNNNNNLKLHDHSNIWECSLNTNCVNANYLCFFRYFQFVVVIIILFEMFGICMRMGKRSW